MKKLYRKGTVHPSPPVISDHLSFLPATILTLTAALSPEDREVLAYLISCFNNNLPGNVHHRKSKSTGASGGARGNNNSNSSSDHPPFFTCDCFRCYMSYWVKWDSSPNRQLIHEIIDAFEDELLQQNNKRMKNSKKEKKRRSGNNNSGELKRITNNNNHQLCPGKKSAESESVEENSIDVTDDDEGDHQHQHHDEEEEKSSLRSFMSFIGERIWGVWG